MATVRASEWEQWLREWRCGVGSMVFLVDGQGWEKSIQNTRIRAKCCVRKTCVSILSPRQGNDSGLSVFPRGLGVLFLGAVCDEAYAVDPVVRDVLWGRRDRLFQYHPTPAQA